MNWWQDKFSIEIRVREFKKLWAYILCILLLLLIIINYIDVTRNRDVAEFFAYTYWDKNNKCYKPITANYSPRIYRAKMADNL